MSQIQELKSYFDIMWKDYCQLNPQARAVYDALTNFGEKVVNDHIAFRTFRTPKINVDTLATHFTDYGYKLIGEYEFKEKKLKAKHYEHADAEMPKVFISELDLQQTSPFIREVVNKITQEFDAQTVRNKNFMYSGRPWGADFTTYQKLAQESEYAAWVYAHGFRPNHFTVYINYLKKLNAIQDLNAFLKNNGFKLNAAGGEIKGTPADYLEQSSTMANEIPVNFKDGLHTIPACYYEFAKRYPLANGKLFQGFVAQSADKIFESTHQAR